MTALPADAAQAQSRSDPGRSSSVAPYYTFDISPDVVGIMLNTARPDGSIKTVLDARQAEWLEEQLQRVSQRYYSAKGKLTKSDTKDRLVILFSHHPLSSFEKDEPSSGGGPQPLNPSAVLELISRFPNVVAWMNGHIHRHRVTPHKAKYETGGFGKSPPLPSLTTRNSQESLNFWTTATGHC